VLTWLRDKWKRDLVTLRDRREKEHRNRKGLCPRCGYDVEDLPGQPCPECGLFIESAWREGRLGAGSLNRDILASVGMISSGSLASYIAFIVISIAIMGHGLPFRAGLRKDIVPAAFLSFAFLSNAALAAYGWRNRRRFLHGPARPAVIYVAVCLSLTTLTFGLWALLVSLSSSAS